MNQLSKEDSLSKCADLIKTVAGWSIKTVLGVILGLNFIQSLVMPAFDSLKNGWAMRVTSAVPGVGDAMGTAMQTVIGSAVLIKNGIGAAGLIVLAFLFLIPAVKLAVIVLMYQAAQALVQPVADKRMLTCLHSVSEGVLLLLKIQGGIYTVFRPGDDDGGVGRCLRRIREETGKMMDIFREWIQNVVVFLLLMTMAGQLIPEEKYRKYIHLTMGLLLILVILLPLTKLTGMEEKIYQNFIRESFRISAADARAGESIVGAEGQFSDGYRQMIREEVRLYFEANSMVMKYCELDMDDDAGSENYGQIYQMRVGIVPKDRNMDETDSQKEIEKEISVGEIQIGKGKYGDAPDNSEISNSSPPKEKIEQWRKDILLQFGIEEEQLELEILS